MAECECRARARRGGLGRTGLLQFTFGDADHRFRLWRYWAMNALTLMLGSRCRSSALRWGHFGRHGADELAGLLDMDNVYAALSAGYRLNEWFQVSSVVSRDWFIDDLNSTYKPRTSFYLAVGIEPPRQR